MEESDEGVESSDGEGGDAVVAHEGVEKGEQAVDSVERGLSGTDTEMEIGLLLFEKMPEDGEVGLGTRPFDPTGGIHGIRFGKAGDEAG